jgi:hypothetical protein
LPLFQSRCTLLKSAYIASKIDLKSLWRSADARRGESIDLAGKHQSAAKDMVSASGTEIVRDTGVSRFTMQKQLTTEHIPHFNERSGN